MLTRVGSAADYAAFLENEKARLSFSDHKRLKKDNQLFSALWRFKKLDFSSAGSLILPLYSQDGGRNAYDPAILFRSFLLMQRLKYSSIDKWVGRLESDPLLQYVIGTRNAPGLATHYDFINRLMGIDPHMDELYPKGYFNKENRAKLKKNEKWINYTDDDTRALKEKYLEGNGAEHDATRKSYLIEQVFNIIAVNQSIKEGYIPADESLILSGDGSCKHIHASANGHHVENPVDDDHTHRYSAPDANWGWDSDLEAYYFGFTMFNISYHGEGYDLPVHLTLTLASQHDALTSMSSFASLRHLNPSLKPKYVCHDSAMDAYDIFEFYRKQGIIPVIDWNQRSTGSKNPYAEFESINEKGIPVCMNGSEMVRDGYDKSKMATKYRCPLKMGRICDCQVKDQCSKSSYGRVIKTYDKTNLKLFGPVPYQSEEWKRIYKNRTCTERINNRILNDYGLHKLGCRNGSKNFFFMIMAGINIHADVWCKNQSAM